MSNSPKQWLDWWESHVVFKGFEMWRGSPWYLRIFALVTGPLVVFALMPVVFPLLVLAVASDMMDELGHKP